ncbi:hypothetical protein GGH94_001173 [Coemansia aciculifera]|uniref:Gelsolin-like domain-containing protein n=1 Tax=Coemansia aciculifera TaxID=417176 RepID=A0A9W8IPD1_9FUNG|nr:hypothetical protein GGH94_001173 [Coemansia aciculifera]
MDNLLDCDIAPSAVLPLAADKDSLLSGPAKCLSVGSTDVIVPFHTARVPAQRASKAMPLSRATHSGSKNRYNRVRRRSPLCHDMLEFMLEGASMSSQESLPLETAVAANNPNVGSNVNIRHSHCALGTVMTGTNLDIAFADECPRRRDLASNATISSDQRPNTCATRPNPLAVLAQQRRSKGDIPTPPTSDHASDDGGSDDEANGNSDDGFDGQCLTPSITTSPTSTAECSRSNSYRSSHSSEASDDATAAEPSLNWWKRKFKGAKYRPAPRLSAPLRSDSLASDSDASSARPALSNSTPVAAAARSKSSMTMLTKLRRSVSYKKSAKSPTPEPARRSHTVVASPKKLIRTAKEAPLPPLTAAHWESPGRTDAATRPASELLHTPPLITSLGEDDDTFEAQWIMLKCKGMVNLHVVSVPASISSLNHKDAFLFYPCLFRKLSATRVSGLGATVSPALKNAATELSFTLLDAQSSAGMSRLHVGTLLAQEYNRRKSICSLASRVIYAWIGAHASVLKRDAIIRVAMEIRDKELMGKATIVVVDESTTADSARRKLFTQLHLTEHAGRASPPSDMATLCRQLTPLSKAGDDLDFERALERRKVAYGFWETVPPATILSVGADINAAMLLKVPIGGVVVLDTWSDVFIWWRDEPGNPAVRKCATEFANMLVRDACIPPRPKSASVWHELRGFEHIVFKTKFSDWPFVFASSMAANTHTARRIVPAAASNMTLPIRSPSHSLHAVVVT